MNQNDEFQDVFSLFGETELSEENIVSIEKFICHLYNYPKLSDINDARTSYFV